MNYASFGRAERALCRRGLIDGATSQHGMRRLRYMPTVLNSASHSIGLTVSTAHCKDDVVSQTLCVCGWAVHVAPGHLTHNSAIRVCRITIVWATAQRQPVQPVSSIGVVDPWSPALLADVERPSAPELLPSCRFFRTTVSAGYVQGPCVRCNHHARVALRRTRAAQLVEKINPGPCTSRSQFSDLRPGHGNVDAPSTALNFPVRCWPEYRLSLGAHAR